MTKEKLIKEGRLAPDGRNKQAIFYNISPQAPSVPDDMTAREQYEYWLEYIARK